MSAAEDVARPVFRQFAECAWCRAPFQIKAPGQLYGSDSCRYKAKHAGASTSPEYRAKIRERCRRWSEAKRGVKRREPWLLGQPIYNTHLPGGFLEMHLDHPLKWPIEHRNVRALHAVVTTLTGEHHETIPRFALVPWHRGIGWGVYLGEDALLDNLAGTRHAVRLFEHGRELRFGGAIRMKAPSVVKRGHRKLRIDALTPICVRNQESTAFNAANLLSTLCAWLPRRIGLEIGHDDAQLRIVASDVRRERVELGGKFGVVDGWVGHVVVDCNAVAEWLLRTAEVMGLGGRVAYGFGRIEVSDAG